MGAARTWYTEQVARIWQKYDCNPMKSFLGLGVNGTLFISFFLALRGLSDAKMPSMTHEGLAWFRDLTIADPFYVLPVLSSALMLLTVELGAADGMQGQTESTMKNMKLFLRVLSVAIIPFTLQFQSSILLYWIASNSFSLGQTLLLKNPTARKVLGIPSLPQKKVQAVQATVGTPAKTFRYPPKKKTKAKAAR